MRGVIVAGLPAMALPSVQGGILAELGRLLTLRRAANGAQDWQAGLGRSCARKRAANLPVPNDSLGDSPPDVHGDRTGRQFSPLRLAARLGDAGARALLPGFAAAVFVAAVVVRARTIVTATDHAAAV